MKFLKNLSLIALIGIAISCSKDDDPQPNVEDAALSFAQNQQVLEVPDGLLQSDDPKAQEAATWLTMANSMSANLALFNPPPGATKQSELITPVNARTSASTGVVYMWNDSQLGNVAYQIQDTGNKYIFELFFKGADDAGWYRYLYAEELKDGSRGSMVLLDAWGVFDDTRSAEIISWSWGRSGDIFTFSMSDKEGGFNFTVEVNTKTKAGSIVYYYDSVKQSEITWDAQGKGSWKEFDESGAVTDQGTWD